MNTDVLGHPVETGRTGDVSVPRPRVLAIDDGHGVIKCATLARGSHPVSL